MVKTCRSGKQDESDHWPDAVRGNKHSTTFDLSRQLATKLISSNLSSHDKHFIVMSHYGHVTMKWEGREPPLLSLKGGRTNGRKARLLTRKMREDPAF